MTTPQTNHQPPIPHPHCPTRDTVHGPHHFRLGEPLCWCPGAEPLDLDQLDVDDEPLAAGETRTWPPLTAEEVAELTAWARGTQGGARVWLEHDTALTAAARILETRMAAALAQRIVLEPAESLALQLGLAAVLEGRGAPPANTASMCILALARLTGRHDWTQQPAAEVDA